MFLVQNPSFSPAVLGGIGKSIKLNSKGEKFSLFYPRFESEKVQQFVSASCTLLLFGAALFLATRGAIKLDSFVVTFFEKQSLITSEWLALVLSQNLSFLLISQTAALSLSLLQKGLAYLAPGRSQPIRAKAGFRWGWHVVEKGIKNALLITQLYKMATEKNKPILIWILQLGGSIFLIRDIRVPVLPPKLEAFAIADFAYNHFSPSRDMKYRIVADFFDYRPEESEDLEDPFRFFEHLTDFIRSNSSSVDFAKFVQGSWGISKNIPAIIRQFKMPTDLLIANYAESLARYRLNVFQNAVFASDSFQKISEPLLKDWERGDVDRFVQQGIAVYEQNLDKLSLPGLVKFYTFFRREKLAKLHKTFFGKLLKKMFQIKHLEDLSLQMFNPKDVPESYHMIYMAMKVYCLKMAKNKYSAEDLFRLVGFRQCAARFFKEHAQQHPVSQKIQDKFQEFSNLLIKYNVQQDPFADAPQ